MAGRAGQLRRAWQVRIGGQVLAARQAGVPWKHLEGCFGRDRSTLFRYARRARCNIFAIASHPLGMDGWPALRWPSAAPASHRASARPTARQA